MIEGKTGISFFGFLGILLVPILLVCYIPDLKVSVIIIIMIIIIIIIIVIMMMIIMIIVIIVMVTIIIMSFFVYI